MVSNIPKALLVVAAIGLGGCMTAAPMASKSPSAISYIGGAAMYPTKNIIV